MLGREESLEKLEIFFKHPELQLPAAISITGPPQCGKHLLVKTVLDRFLHLNVAHVSCQSATFHQKMVLESALVQWAGGKSRKKPDSELKCDQMSDFVKILQSRRSLFIGSGIKGLVLVLRKSEKLRDLDFNLLPGFMRLRELTGLNICVVLLSSISFHNFLVPPHPFPMPLFITLRPYTSEELCQIIALKLQDKHENVINMGNDGGADEEKAIEFSKDFYINYVHLIIALSYTSCNLLPQLGHLAESHFHLYIDPIRKKEVKSDNVRALLRHIEKPLKESLAAISLQETSSQQLLNVEKQNDPLFSAFNQAQKRFHVELPFHSKFLLIASYLASYNPAKSDRRFFMKHHGKQRKTKAMVKSKESRIPSQLTGPKSFPLERMMAIFYAIIDEDVTPSANILSQISSLVTLQFLTQINASDMLESPKYKCAVGFEFIKVLSKQVSFEVHRYLYDFL